MTWHRATTRRRDHRYVEAVATARALAFARAWPTRPSTSSTCRRRRRSTRSVAPRRPASGSSAETCPHYLVLTEERLRRARPGPVRPLRHLAAAPLRRRPRRAVGRPGRRLARPRRDGPRPGSARRREGRGRARRAVQRDQQRRSGHRDAAHDPLQRRRRARAGSRSSGWSTSSRRPPPAGSASAAKGAIEVGRDADLVLFDPAARRTIRADRPPPHERLHAVRGPRGRGRGPGRVRPRPSASSVTAPSSVGAGTAPSSSEDSRPVDALE